MNKLKEFEKLMVKYRSVKNGDIEKCGKRMNELWNWINQNYISKEEILNLECLKEEECIKGGKHEWETHSTNKGFITYCSKCGINESWVLSENHKIKEIIDEINKL